MPACFHTALLTLSVLFTLAAAPRGPLPLPSSPGAVTAPGVSSPEAGGQGDRAGLVDIGGRSLYLVCRGEGSPTVVLEAGAGNDGRIWDTAGLPAGAPDAAVLPGVATFTRVCAYDRPGTYLAPHDPGRSGPVPMPRTAGEMSADLHALLAAAREPGPYVLVGHSFGGLVVRLYASRYPEDVAGLVLVDAAHEDYYAAVQGVMTAAQWNAFVPGADDPDYPDLERIDTQRSAGEMREAAAASPLRPMPLVVITHGQPWSWPADLDAAALEGVWFPLQLRLAALVPDARLVVAEESGHYIQLEQPGLVLGAIRQVVEAVRDPSSWSAP